MVLDRIYLTGKTGVVIIGGVLRAERYQDEILQSVTVPYLQSLHLNPSEHLWDQLGCAVCARVMVLLHAAEAPVC